MQYIGIDTGWSGAAVLLGEAGSLIKFECGFKSPNELFWALANLSGPCSVAALECIAFGPKGGRKQMARFGEAYGIAQAAMISRAIPLTIVRAKQWQGMILNKADGPDPKARARVAFDRLFPSHADTKHSGVIDAALIAEWLRRTNGGT